MFHNVLQDICLLVIPAHYKLTEKTVWKLGEIQGHVFKMERTQHTFLGGLDWTVLAGNEIMGKSSDRVGGGEEVAGVLEAGVPFPPAQTKTIGN